MPTPTNLGNRGGLGHSYGGRSGRWRLGDRRSLGRSSLSGGSLDRDRDRLGLRLGLAIVSSGRLGPAALCGLLLLLLVLLLGLGLR